MRCQTVACYILCLTFITRLAIAQAPYSVWSNEANYQEGLIELQGDVTMEFPQALVMADLARIRASTESSEQIDLLGHIRVRIDQGGSITASSAQIYPCTKQVSFVGCFPLERVVCKVADRQAPFTVICDHLRIHSQETFSMHATGNVEIYDSQHIHIWSNAVTIQSYDPVLSPQQVAALYTERPSPSHLITLEGESRIDYEALGTFIPSGTLYVTGTVDQKKFEPDLIVSQDSVRWVASEMSERNCEFFGPSGLLIDNRIKRAIIEGSGRKVQFTDSTGRAWSDRMRIDFLQPEASPLTVSSLSLEGSVEIELQKGEQTVRALADQLRYDLISDMLILQASPGRNVLVCNSKGSKISAQAVTVERHSQTIHGIGTVRIILTEAELAQLKKPFGTL